MKTEMKELNMSEMEMVNGGSAYIYFAFRRERIVGNGHEAQLAA